MPEDERFVNWTLSAGGGGGDIGGNLCDEIVSYFWEL
jgi:hypothetical protein